ncbi:MAG: PEP-CTERM sorting domain-containing protein [Bryobacteraceae bacterium]|jgi:hypothetical protein
MLKSSVLIAVALLALALVPARAATITQIGITTNGNAPPYGGIWGTSGAAAIGVSLPGASNNPFLDPGGVMSVASGDYLLFLGYEDRFAGALPGDISLLLTVTYSDSSTRIATFSNASLASPSIWSRLSGDSSLLIGSSGITSVDRVGSDPSGTYNPNGVNDVVLRFSDTGSFPGSGSGVPEPATFGLMAGGLAAVVLSRRRKLS